MRTVKCRGGEWGVAEETINTARDINLYGLLFSSLDVDRFMAFVAFSCYLGSTDLVTREEKPCATRKTYTGPVPVYCIYYGWYDFFGFATDLELSPFGNKKLNLIFRPNFSILNLPCPGILDWHNGRREWTWFRFAAPLSWGHWRFMRSRIIFNHLFIRIDSGTANTRDASMCVAIYIFK